MIRVSKTYIDNKIGGYSLVGVDENSIKPVNFGNYFEFASGHYCLNMWHENLEEIKRLIPNLEKIEVLEFDDEESRKFCLIIDKNIPQRWLNRELCISGCREISETMRTLLSKYGL